MDYMKKFLRMALISVVVLALGAVVGGVFGMRLGPEYTVGTLVAVDVKGKYELSAVEGALRNAGVSGAVAVKTGSSADAQTLLEVRAPGALDEAGRKALGDKVQAAVAKAYPAAALKSVQPTGNTAADLLWGILMPVLAVCVMAFLYGWVRHGIHAGLTICAVAAYDALLVLAVTLLTRIPVGAAYPAAILITIACSVYQSFVLFENMREIRASDKQAAANREQLAVTCVQNNLVRFIVTPALAALITLALVLTGTFSALTFAVPVWVGLSACLFSAAFLTAPLWVAMQTGGLTAKQAKRPAKKQAKKK